MEERYTRLFSLPENLYSAGAPVMIAAGALLKDNQTGKVLAQLKLRSLVDQKVKAVKVKIAPLDMVGKPLGEAVDHLYLDLNASRDMEFGQKVPIPLPDATTRGFQASVLEVVFADNTLWAAGDAPWEPLSAPVPLAQALADDELAKQYRIQYGEDSVNLFHPERDLWRCACGALNHQNEPVCHKCHKQAAALAALDLEKLKADRDKRLEMEQQKAAEEKAIAEAKVKKSKRIAKIVLPIVILTIIGAAAIIVPRKLAAYRSEFAYVLIEETVINYDGTERTKSYSYDNEGNLTKIDFGDGQVNTYTYDSTGNRLSAYLKGHNGSYTEYTYQYDSAGNCVEIRETDDEGTDDSTIYQYDSKGNCIQESADVSYLEESYVIDYTYDDAGNIAETKKLTQEWGWNGDTEMSLTVYEYDSAGNCIKEIYYNDGHYQNVSLDEQWREAYWDWTREYQYDSSGNCVKETYRYYDSTNIEQTSNIFDEKGNCVEKIYTNADKQQTRTAYRFDEAGNCIEEIVTNEEGQTRTTTSVYSYQHAPNALLNE